MELMIYLKIGLGLISALSCIIAIYKTYKTHRMNDITTEDTYLRMDSQVDALKYAVLGLACAILAKLLSGGI